MLFLSAQHIYLLTFYNAFKIDVLSLFNHDLYLANETVMKHIFSTKIIQQKHECHKTLTQHRVESHKKFQENKTIIQIYIQIVIEIINPYIINLS